MQTVLSKICHIGRKERVLGIRCSYVSYTINKVASVSYSIKGPRVAWGPGHDTYTSNAQEAADKHCKQTGHDKAVFVDGRVKLFDGDYNKFTCTVSTKKVLRLELVRKSLSQIGTCIRATIPKLDDLQSDAKTIATGVGAVCSPLIERFLDVFLRNKQGTKEFNAVYRSEFRKRQFERILPFVLKWRSLVKHGRDKNQPPRQSELPDSMLKINI